MTEDPRFHVKREAGQVWRRYVAHRLADQGLDVTLPDDPAEHLIENAALFADQMDVVVGERVLEVKSRGCDFNTDPRSFPFDPVYLGSVRQWEQRTHRFAVVVVSQRSGHMLAVPGTTRHAWFAVRAYDGIMDQITDCYAVERAALTSFDWLVDQLRS